MNALLSCSGRFCKYFSFRLFSLLIPLWSGLSYILATLVIVFMKRLVVVADVLSYYFSTFVCFLFLCAVPFLFFICLHPFSNLCDFTPPFSHFSEEKKEILISSERDRLWTNFLSRLCFGVFSPLVLLLQLQDMQVPLPYHHPYLVVVLVGR